MEVPEHAGVGDSGLRMALMGPVQGGELDWVSNEKYREIVTNEVPVALLGLELEGEPTDISQGVTRAPLTGNSRDSSEDLGLLAHLSKGGGSTPVGDIMCTLKLTPGTSSLGVDNTITALAFQELKGICSCQSYRSGIRSLGK
jgi:hypothetical protein